MVMAQDELSLRFMEDLNGSDKHYLNEESMIDFKWSKTLFWKPKQIEQRGMVNCYFMSCLSNQR